MAGYIVYQPILRRRSSHSNDKANPSTHFQTLYLHHILTTKRQKAWVPTLPTRTIATYKRQTRRKLNNPITVQFHYKSHKNASYRHSKSPLFSSQRPPLVLSLLISTPTGQITLQPLLPKASRSTSKQPVLRLYREFLSQVNPDSRTNVCHDRVFSTDNHMQIQYVSTSNNPRIRSARMEI